MKAYYWLPAGAAGTVEKENGLPVAFTGETNVRGKKRKCFKAFLHPADYSGTRNGRVCVKFEVVPGEAFVTDGALPDGEAKKYVVDALKYVPGTFRRPVLIVTALPGDADIERYDFAMDEPLLYENSEKLYVDRCFAEADEADPGFREKALRAYYEAGAGNGRYLKFEETIKKGAETAPGIPGLDEVSVRYRTREGNIAYIGIEKKKSTER